jgi:hypothetical protein
MENSFLDALDAVTAGIAAVVNDTGIRVEDHPGRFTETELGRILTKKRSVRVAVEQVPTLQILGSGHFKAELLFTVFIICSDTRDQGRHRSALALAEKILKAVPHNRWQTQFLKPVLPASINADNLYSSEIDKKGIALWALSWQQGFSNH